MDVITSIQNISTTSQLINGSGNLSNISAKGTSSYAQIVSDEILYPLMVMCVLAVCENVFVCYLIYSNRSLRNTTNVFVFSLCVTNILFSALLLPLHCFYESSPAYSFLTLIIILMYILNLTAVTFERLVSITKPLHYHNYVTKKRAYKITLGSYSLSLVYCLIPLLWRADRNLVVHKVYITATLLVFLIAPLLFILAVYGKVCIETKRFFNLHGRFLVPSTSEGHTRILFKRATFFCCFTKDDLVDDVGDDISVFEKPIEQPGIAGSSLNSNQIDRDLLILWDKKQVQQSSACQNIASPSDLSFANASSVFLEECSGLSSNGYRWLHELSERTNLDRAYVESMALTMCGTCDPSVTKIYYDTGTDRFRSDLDTFHRKLALQEQVKRSYCRESWSSSKESNNSRKTSQISHKDSFKSKECVFSFEASSHDISAISFTSVYQPLQSSTLQTMKQGKKSSNQSLSSRKVSNALKSRSYQNLNGMKSTYLCPASASLVPSRSDSNLCMRKEKRKLEKRASDKKTSFCFNNPISFLDDEALQNNFDETTTKVNKSSCIAKVPDGSNVSMTSISNFSRKQSKAETVVTIGNGVVLNKGSNHEPISDIMQISGDAKPRFSRRPKAKFSCALLPSQRDSQRNFVTSEKQLQKLITNLILRTEKSHGKAWNTPYERFEVSSGELTTSEFVKKSRRSLSLPDFPSFIRKNTSQSRRVSRTNQPYDKQELLTEDCPLVHQQLQDIVATKTAGCTPKSELQITVRKPSDSRCYQFLTDGQPCGEHIASNVSYNHHLPTAHACSSLTCTLEESDKEEILCDSVENSNLNGHVEQCTLKGTNPLHNSHSKSSICDNTNSKKPSFLHDTLPIIRAYIPKRSASSRNLMILKDSRSFDADHRETSFIGLRRKRVGSFNIYLDDDSQNNSARQSPKIYLSQYLDNPEQAVKTVELFSPTAPESSPVEKKRPMIPDFGSSGGILKSPTADLTDSAKSSTSEDYRESKERKKISFSSETKYTRLGSPCEDLPETFSDTSSILKSNGRLPSDLNETNVDLTNKFDEFNTLHFERNFRFASGSSESKSRIYSNCSSRTCNTLGSTYDFLKPRTSSITFSLSRRGSHTIDRLRNRLLEIKTSLAFALVALTYMFTWLPVVYMSFLEVIDMSHLRPESLPVISIFTIGFNAMVDPLLYGLLLKDFRKAIKRTFRNYRLRKC